MNQTDDVLFHDRIKGGYVTADYIAFPIDAFKG